MFETMGLDDDADWKQISIRQDLLEVRKEYIKRIGKCKEFVLCIYSIIRSSSDSSSSSSTSSTLLQEYIYENLDPTYTLQTVPVLDLLFLEIPEEVLWFLIWKSLCVSFFGIPYQFLLMYHLILSFSFHR